MEVLATKEQVKELPQPVKALLKNAWGEPDENGVRQAQNLEDPSRSLNNFGVDVAKELTQTLTNPEKVYQLSNYKVTDKGGYFDFQMIWRDPITKAFYQIIVAWNGRKAIGTCHVCGSLFLPAKGRTAKFCSPKCRLKAHREGK